jgi:two-component system chemotaxis response regulator CheB
MAMEEFRNLIVIGASAGGHAAVRKLIAQLDVQINAAVLVVLHVSKKSSGDNISYLLQKHTRLICSCPPDGTVMEKGHLYIATPNHHMMVRDGQISISQGARENKYRPSIDVLFRSAAVHYGARVIGIILTGLLDDGTSGMSAIKRCGGITVVQEPADAEYDDMPQSVINFVPVDHRSAVAEMGAVLISVLNEPLPPAIPIPRELEIEATLTENRMTSINQLKEIADHSDFTCPECGGGLWAIHNDPVHRYRCHTGHVFTERSLCNDQGFVLEESAWVAIRMLEERRNLLALMGTHAEEAGNAMMAEEYKQRSQGLVRHIDAMKFILLKLTDELEGSPNAV